MPSVTIRFQSNYGQNVAYPVCHNANRFAELIRKRTFAPSDLQLIQELGYTIEVHQPVPKGWDMVIA